MDSFPFYMVKKEETRMKEKLQVTGPIREDAQVRPFCGIKIRNAGSFHHWNNFTRVVFLKEMVVRRPGGQCPSVAGLLHHMGMSLVFLALGRGAVAVLVHDSVVWVIMRTLYKCWFSGVVKAELVKWSSPIDNKSKVLFQWGHADVCSVAPSEQCGGP